jgi:hypothetical protein
MAYAAAKFAESCLKAMAGEAGVVECAYVQSGLTDMPFFASRLLLGPSGVQVRPLSLPHSPSRFYFLCGWVPPRSFFWSVPFSFVFSLSGLLSASLFTLRVHSPLFSLFQIALRSPFYLVCALFDRFLAFLGFLAFPGIPSFSRGKKDGFDPSGGSKGMLAAF